MSNHLWVYLATFCAGTAMASAYRSLRLIRNEVRRATAAGALVVGMTGCAVIALFTIRSFAFAILTRSGSSPDATLTLGFFSIVATLVAGYAVLVTQRFERQRADLVEQVSSAGNAAQSLAATATAQATALRNAELRQRLMQDRFQAFLCIHRELQEIGPAGTSPGPFVLLKLLESLLARESWSERAFDMVEIQCAASSDPHLVRRLLDPALRTYFGGLKDLATVEGSTQDPVVLEVLSDVESLLSATR